MAITNSMRCEITVARSIPVAVLPPTNAVAPPSDVASGMTFERRFSTSADVVSDEGADVEMTFMIAASPLLLICGGDTAATWSAAPMSFWSRTRRGSVPRSSPPAFVSMRVSCFFNAQRSFLLFLGLGGFGLEVVGLALQGIALLLQVGGLALERLRSPLELVRLALQCFSLSVQLPSLLLEVACLDTQWMELRSNLLLSLLQTREASLQPGTNVRIIGVLEAVVDDRLPGVDGDEMQHQGSRLARERPRLGFQPCFLGLKDCLLPLQGGLLTLQGIALSLEGPLLTLERGLLRFQLLLLGLELLLFLLQLLLERGRLVVLLRVLGARLRRRVELDGDEQRTVVSDPESLRHHVVRLSFGRTLRRHPNVLLTQHKREQGDDERGEEQERQRDGDPRMRRDPARPGVPPCLALGSALGPHERGDRGGGGCFRRGARGRLAGA